MSYKDSKFGFTDFSNNQVVPNKFDAVHCFVFGYAPVAIGDKWGIIDKKGKFIVEPIYDYAGGFGPEGLAGVLQNNQIGFVDTTGSLVIPFKYYWTKPWTTTPDYPFFTNGLLAVIDAKGDEEINEGKVGCINTKGTLVIPAVYDYISYFWDGIATAKKGDELFLIDTLGNVVLELKEVHYGSLFFEDGYSVFYSEEGKSGIIKKDGRIILESKYNGVEMFSEGFAAVQIDANETGVTSGFVDTTGQFVFNKTFGFVRSFHEGYAAVEIGGRWGFIDKTGKIIIEPLYSDVKDFHDGIAIVGIQKGKQLKYGYLDQKGKFALEPIYNEAGDFKYGLAPVKIGKKFGFIDKSGDIIIEPKFDNAFSFQKETLGWIK